MTPLISWLIVGVAAMHVAEESIFGWVSWANQFIKGVTRPQFIIGNALFILLCILGALSTSLILKLSLAALLLINVFVHLLPTVVRRQYSPGLISAMILYLPLGTYAYYFAVRNSLINTTQLIASFTLGATWMLLPFLYQGFRALRVSA